VSESNPIQRLLICNRGEIAVRICRTARAMGIPTVGVFSSVDRNAFHTRYVDQAVELPGEDPRGAYLDMDAILEIAAEHNCDAIHPGYGFLSENADFSERCKQAGVRFVGPAADTIRDMGGKIRARELMKEANVPVIPGIDAGDDDALIKGAQDVGYPLLVKASAGGGGKGMRRVEAPEELAEALAAARREAAGSFGDATVYLEHLVRPARHIEVQILGDTHGNVVHLGERDCSAQRRYQKVVELAPAPELPDDVRTALCEAAVQAAKAVNYVGAGTVEFVLGPDNSFYFLEMNTRLQVEHAITEEVFGVDLVKAQLEVAAGQPLRFSQDDLVGRGCSVECRIYAEDPAAGFLPAPGHLVSFVMPSGAGIRFDTGVQSGDTISADYDPMIAKLICTAGDREAALSLTEQTLRETVILGTKTNLVFLADLVAAMKETTVDTQYIEREMADWQAQSELSDRIYGVAAVFDALESGGRATGSGSDDTDLYSPWRPGAVKGRA